jgi:hypothetical protein
MRKIKILALCLISLTSCKHANLTVCVSNPAQDGMECSKGSAKPYHLPYKDSENYIAMPPDDARTLFDECYKEKP